MNIMQRRLDASERYADYRKPLLTKVLLDGAAWEMSSIERTNLFCNTVATKSQQYEPKRTMHGQLENIVKSMNKQHFASCKEPL